VFLIRGYLFTLCARLANVCNTCTCQLVGPLVRDGSHVVGDTDWPANRPDGDHTQSAAGEVCNFEIAKTLRDRALRGNVA